MDTKHCHECGATIPMIDAGGVDLPAVECAEVYLDAATMKANAGGQAVLVDELPDDAFGPFLVHVECYLGTRPKYELA